MRNPAAPQGMQQATVLIRGLFVVLLLLQLADLHSTLVAGAGQYESNKLLNRLAMSVTFPGALAVVKGFDLAMIAALYWTSRQSPGLNRVFAACLCVLVAAYAAVVLNNYRGG